MTSAASALKDRNLIRYSRVDVSVLDVRGLEQAACPCYAIDKKTYSRVLVRKGKANGASSILTSGAAQLAGAELDGAE